ncbi:MAG: DUF202 domain-containing protein [Acidimicrobiia bacterium]
MSTRPPGLADERTDLAWNRSGLALIACGLIVMRGFALHGLPPAQVAVGAVILVMGATTYAVAGWHAQRRLRPGRLDVAATQADLLPVALGVATVGLAAFVLGALFPS